MINTSALKGVAQELRNMLMEQTKNKINAVLALDSIERREHPKAVNDLENKIQSTSLDSVIEEVSYVWFNRFCAIRYLDVKDYLPVRIISPIDGQSQPNVLAEAKAGDFCEEIFDSEKEKSDVTALLLGTKNSRDPQGEAYSILLNNAIKYLTKIFPYLFSDPEDFYGILKPTNLLSKDSVISKICEVMSKDACADIEIIGWLYQYYISEKKDVVFKAVKEKKQKISKENIPAATQLFTPHWIVKYIVENSLGRLWMLNHPESTLASQMEYYIKPNENESDFLKISNPEEIKICDPACGSGHMLTYAFDLLYKIYEEQGYDPSSISELILKNNLFGIEIDKRASQLAYFALMMKGREKCRRLFKKTVTPNILHLEKIEFDETTKADLAKILEKENELSQVLPFLDNYKEADNFGSLISPKIKVTDSLEDRLSLLIETSDLLTTSQLRLLQKFILQEKYLSKHYHILIANPPYMGNRGMNDELKKFAKKNYPKSCSDLYSMFIEQGFKLNLDNGFCSMVTMQSWMFLPTFEELRKFILDSKAISSMIHIGTRGFDSIGGEVVATTAFTIRNSLTSDGNAKYYDLTQGNSELEKDCKFKSDITSNSFYNASSKNFSKIPGSPIAYWLSEKVLNIFASEKKMGDVCQAKQGLATADNDRFLRQWYEISIDKFCTTAKSCEETKTLPYKWYPYNKGGEYRKWFGNITYVVNWEHDGFEIRNFKDSKGKLRSAVRNPTFYFKEGLTWSLITSSANSFRYIESGAIFDVAGMSVFFDNRNQLLASLGLSNSNFAYTNTKVINPTVNFQIGDFVKLPYLSKLPIENLVPSVEECIRISKDDWNSYEITWDFKVNPLVKISNSESSLEATYNTLRTMQKQLTSRLHELECQNNQEINRAYDIEDEFSSDVNIENITLTCNPYYRYRQQSDKSEGKLEELFKKDTIKELISYAVGCMFGRYSLDKDGLILAKQGQSVEDYFNAIPNPRFKIDEDNVIPFLDTEYFEDDIVTRFNSFIKVAFGEQHYDENIRFITKALGVDFLRDYFTKFFYDDHCSMYGKRPIYWMFSSPKNSFNVLIYIHRYRKDTVSVILNDYLRNYRSKIDAEIQHETEVLGKEDLTTAQQSKLSKQLDKHKKIIVEIEAYEKDVLYPMSLNALEMNLDDGVKANYAKFGKALRKIK